MKHDLVYIMLMLGAACIEPPSTAQELVVAEQTNGITHQFAIDKTTSKFYLSEWTDTKWCVVHEYQYTNNVDVNSKGIFTLIF